VERIIIFTDYSTLLVPSLLVDATVKAAAEMKHFQIAGICVRNYQKYNHLLYRHFRAVLKTSIKSYFDDTRQQKFSRPLPINIDKLARQHGFKVLIPPNENINHTGFIQQIRTELEPTVALSFYCLQRFSSELLQKFEYAVNYHNGILPEYRGLRATCWSIYHQDSTTGYTFHRINKKIDQGNILIKRMVPLQTDSRVPDIEYKKAVCATDDIPDLLEIIKRREIGQVQTGLSNYFSRDDAKKNTFINIPSNYSHAELANRLRAFGILQINIKGFRYPVTKLETMSVPPKNSNALYFYTSDGKIMRPSRFRFLPFFMYRILKTILIDNPSASCY